MVWLLVFALLAPTTVVLAADDADSFLPSGSLNLKLAAPIDKWDEAIPLGN